MSGIKKFFIYTCLTGSIVLLLNTPGIALADMQNDPEETFAIVQRAISQGNVQLMSKYMGTYTEVSILGATTMYSRAQTAYILKAFFRDHPPERFSFQHKLRVGKDWFVHGRYWNRGTDRPYRLEMTMRWNGRKIEIKSIRIKYFDEP